MTWKDRLPPIEAFELTAWPQPASLDDYARATDEVLELLHRLNKDASVYGFGSVGMPGFSDLDFVLVLDDDAPSIGLERWEALKGILSPKTSYILLHRPFIVNRSLWGDFMAANTFSEMRHLAGPILPVPPPTSQSTDLLQLIKYVEATVLFPYGGLIKPILRRQIRVRPLLNVISRVRHKAKVLEDLGIRNPGWAACMTDVGQLRHDWFSLDADVRIHSLYDLTIRAIEIETEMIEVTARLLPGYGLAIEELGRTGRDVVGVFDSCIAFVDQFDAQREHEFIVRSDELAGSAFYLLPAVFMVPFLVYIARGSHLSGHLADRLAVFTEVPPLQDREFPAELQSRLEMLEPYLRFLDERRVKWGMLFDRLSEPKRSVEPARVFWKRAEPYIAQPEDVIPFGLRRQLAEAQAQTLAIMQSETWRVAWFIRGLRDKIAPPNSLLDRLYGRLVSALSTLRRPPAQPDEQPAAEQ